MKIKICGMMEFENLQEVLGTEPDYLGFIFYAGSVRYMRNKLSPAQLYNIQAKKTGVFVNASEDEVLKTVSDYGLNAVQLHGNEPTEYCQHIRSNKLEVIKAFKIDAPFDFNATTAYKGSCDYFLFDTKGSSEGGNGFAFDWQLLKKYDQKIPFFLSGGISADNISDIAGLKNMNLYGIDINSRAEVSPGIKDIRIVKAITEAIRHL